MLHRITSSQVYQECLQRRKLHNLSGKPVPMFCHPQSKEGFYSCSGGTSSVPVSIHCPLSCCWVPQITACLHPHHLPFRDLKLKNVRNIPKFHHIFLPIKALVFCIIKYQHIFATSKKIEIIFNIKSFFKKKKSQLQY